MADREEELTEYRIAVDRAVGELDGLAEKAQVWELPGVEQGATVARNAMSSLSRRINKALAGDEGSDRG
jgi:hypothetical protein